MANTKLLTIFTPMYNRAYIIENLYQSLLKQTDKDFDWLIIDDGSTDNTEEVIQKYINENKISIKYIKKQNEGKPSAINDALNIADDNELFMIVDSDDYLTSDAVEKIRKNYNDIKDKKDFVGVVGLRGDSQGNPHLEFCGEKQRKKNKYYSLKYIDTDAIDYRFKYKIKGDRAEVFKTEILKKYRFPKIQNEKFIFESIVWYQIAEDGYKQRYFNDVIYITEYMPDGLSKNIENNLKKNPESMRYLCNKCLEWKKIPPLEKMKQCINYYRYGIYSKNKISKLFKECNGKIYSILAIPIAKIHKVR